MSPGMMMQHVSSTCENLSGSSTACTNVSRKLKRWPRVSEMNQSRFPFPQSPPPPPRSSFLRPRRCRHLLVLFATSQHQCSVPALHGTTDDFVCHVAAMYVCIVWCVVAGEQKIQALETLSKDSESLTKIFHLLHQFKTQGEE